MPRYDYECDSCHHRFELKQRFDSEPITECPRCCGISHRRFHSVPLVFKGSGWYVNEHGNRRGARGLASGSDDTSGSGSGSGSESEAKSDSAVRPESKAGSKTESTETPASTKTKGD